MLIKCLDLRAHVPSSPNVIRQRLLFSWCFLWMWLGGWAPSHREREYIPRCFHLSPVRALYHLSCAYCCKPDIWETVTRHPLEITNDLALYLCWWLHGFDIVLFWLWFWLRRVLSQSLITWLLTTRITTTFLLIPGLRLVPESYRNSTLWPT